MPDRESPRKAAARFWRRFWWACLLLIIPLWLLIWISFFHKVPLEISKETTYITEPLTPDGKLVDYFHAMEQEIYPPGMKTDQNGCRLIVRALGPGIDLTRPGGDLVARETYKKLGLNSNIPPTMTYQQPYIFLRNYLASFTADELPAHLNLEPKDFDSDVASKLQNRLYNPWTIDKMPMMADWIKENEPALDLVAEAVRKPEFCCPLVEIPPQKDFMRIITPSYEPITLFRELTRGFAVRANYRLGKGDLDGAIHDILTIKILGRRVSQQGMIVHMLVGIALEGIANRVNLAGSLEHQPTEAQLRHFVAELQNLPPQATFEKCMRYERFFILDIAQTLSRKKGKLEDLVEIFWHEPGKAESIALKATHVFEIDWNTVMRRLNDHYDHPHRFIDSPSSDSTSLISTDMLLPTSRSELLADYIAEQFLPALRAVDGATHRQKCSNRVQRLVLAMLLYEKRHGRLPPAYTVDAERKPLHSWRVHLLPYLGEKAKKLYKQIKLDEPWDSEHNRRFHTAAVEFYQCPSAKLKPGETTYSVIVGEKAAFQPGEGKTLQQLGPKSRKMIFVLDANSPACWMDPTSDFTESDAKTSLSMHVHPYTIIIGLRGGGVTSITPAIMPNLFQHGVEGTDPTWRDY
ncbi:MAG: DUF1559 domain-containing protein [Planctomycetia bacterium]|jgi:hypothetical protein